MSGHIPGQQYPDLRERRQATAQIERDRRDRGLCAESYAGQYCPEPLNHDKPSGGSTGHVLRYKRGRTV